MTILVKKVFISSKPTFVYLLCPPLCGPFSIQESAAGGLSYKVKKSTPPSAFLQQNNYLKKGGELIITYQLEYYEKNLISSIYIRCLSVYGYMISIKHEEIV